MNYEIINPSDAYTFEAPTYPVAAAVVILLGEGKYGGRSEDGKEEIPLFLFGGHESFIAEHFAGDPSGWIDGNRDAIAVALDSVMSFGFGQRLAYDEAIKLLRPDDVQSYRNKIHDANRSSLNDIGGRAWAIAKHLRASAGAA